MHFECIINNTGIVMESCPMSKSPSLKVFALIEKHNINDMMQCCFFNFRYKYINNTLQKYYR